MFKTHLRQIYSHNPSEEQPFELIILGSVNLFTDGFNWGLVLSHLKLENIVHCICYEPPPKQFRHFSEGFDNGNLKCYEIHRDPCGWMGEHQLAKEKWSDLIGLNSLEDGKKNIVFIDKIEKALLYRSESDLLKDIQYLRRDNRIFQIIIGCASDVISDSFLRALKYTCSCSIDLRFSKILIADITFKKRSGKVIKTSEEFTLNSDLSLTETKLLNSKLSKGGEVQENSVSFHTTFNLSTTIEQDEARRGVVLPHTRVQNSSGAAIHYIPDEGDDWDDEDPDEDLEI